MPVRARTCGLRRRVTGGVGACTWKAFRVCTENACGPTFPSGVMQVSVRRRTAQLTVSSFVWGKLPGVGAGLFLFHGVKSICAFWLFPALQKTGILDSFTIPFLSACPCGKRCAWLVAVRALE